MSNTPAGWYPQPDGQQRYWDGQQWTQHFAPGVQQGISAAAPAAVASAPRPWFKKKRILIPAGLAGTVIFVSALGAAAGGGASQDSALKSSSASSDEATPTADASPAVEAKPSATPTAEPAAPKPAPKPSGPKIGSKVRDGKFQFVVTKMTCGIKTVGNEYLNTKAQGQFCRADMSITNIGDEPQTMFADNQTAFDTKGRKFSADSEASFYDDKSEVLFEEINPGNTVKGRVYFDVPKGVKLAKLELHDSLFSGGVVVALQK